MSGGARTRPRSSGLVNLLELCWEYQFSRKTGYKWLQRLKEGGIEGLRERTRRTKKTGHVLVRYDDVTGHHNHPGQDIMNEPTNVFMIKGTRHISIVPSSPNKTPRSPK